jgi:hypothetical protein
LFYFLDEFVVAGDVGLAFGNMPISLGQVLAFSVLTPRGSAPFRFKQVTCLSVTSDSAADQPPFRAASVAVVATDAPHEIGALARPEHAKPPLRRA